MDIEAAVKTIGGKWKLVALAHLSIGTFRFNELRGLMPNTTPRMLTMTLRDLERDGLITRTAYNEIPPKVEYALTGKGRDLNPLFEALHAWSETHMADTTSQSSRPAATPAGRAERKLRDQTARPPNQTRDMTPARPETTDAPLKSPHKARPWGATAKAKIK